MGKVIDVSNHGRLFRLQEAQTPNRVFCSSMKMRAAGSACHDSWWSIIQYSHESKFRLMEARSPNNVFCSSFKMRNADGAGDDSWWKMSVRSEGSALLESLRAIMQQGNVASME